jgi:endonuclease/exonuclease/phosphatase (EEP) superfamily protein YafD
LIFVLGAPPLVTTLLSLLAPVAWWLDLLTHFRPQYAMALAAAAVLQLVVRPRVLAAAWGTGALLNLAMIGPLYLARPPAVGGPVLRIAHANVAGDDVDVEALATWLVEARPELVFLQEVTPANLPRIERALAAAGLEYATAAAQPRADTRGVALLARREDVEAAIVYPTPDDERPMVQASLELGSSRIAILGFHATRPAPARPYRFQAQGMSAAALWCHANQMGGVEQVLIGDFNSTSQGTLVSELCRRAGLSDARRGQGNAGTWPAHLPAALRVPIDGAYLSRNLVATEVSVGPYIGSDHLPLLVTIQPKR